MDRLPEVGSVVEVVTRHKSHHYFSDKEFEEYTYLGVVIDSPKWIEFNSFSLKTGNPEIDYHIISANNVVGIEYLEGGPGKEVHKSSTVQKFKVKDYTVTKNRSSYSCTCVGYNYHRKCKHITQIIEQLSMEKA